MRCGSQALIMPALRHRQWSRSSSNASGGCRATISVCAGNLEGAPADCCSNEQLNLVNGSCRSSMVARAPLESLHTALILVLLMCAGRDKFMQEVFKWVAQYGNTIFSQLRRIGSSLDWSRQVLLQHLHDTCAFSYALTC